jgi:DNA-binding transcriptional LysR family regulator
MLAEAYASHVPIKVLAMPVPIVPFDLRIYWHERYHHDAPIQWLRKVFVELFRTRASIAGRPKAVVAGRT